MFLTHYRYDQYPYRSATHRARHGTARQLWFDEASQPFVFTLWHVSVGMAVSGGGLGDRSIAGRRSGADVFFQPCERNDSHGHRQLRAPGDTATWTSLA